MEQSHNKPSTPVAGTTHTPPTKNIVESAVAAGRFSTLVAGIRAAGLAETLAGIGPFTVFAPTDEAFKKLPAGALDALLKDTGKLKAVLSYHVIAGHFEARDVKSGEIATVQGSALSAVVSKSGVTVNGAHVTTADVLATNGVIHVIDTVIMPKNWALPAAA